MTFFIYHDILTAGGTEMDNASVILEMLARIQKLEQQVQELHAAFTDLRNQNISNTSAHKEIIEPVKTVPYIEKEVRRRDTTKYLFNGVVYPKNRLVLAVVQDYVNKNAISFEELSAIFHPSLQGSLGVVEKAEIAKTKQDYQVRFFAEETEKLMLTDTCAYVCNQWGILNIPRFLSRAKELGYNIQEIK